MRSAELDQRGDGPASCRATNQAPIRPSANSGSVIARGTPRIRLTGCPAGARAGLQMPSSVACIRERLTQTLRRSPAARPLRGRDRRDGLGQHQRLECGGADLGGAVDPVGVLRILAAEQHRAAGIAHLHALDVAFLQQAPGRGRDGGLVMGSQRGGEQRTGHLADAVRAGFEVVLKLLLDRRVRQPGDIRSVDAMLVVGHPAEQQGEPRADPQGDQ